MKTIAAHTLGCKVNQYDTQAMLEQFERAGYAIVPFSGEADIYLINTCTVTGTGDQKSRKLIRRVFREHPNSDIIACGCLAQRDPKGVRGDGVRLILGVRDRACVVELYEQAVRDGAAADAVSQEGAWTFENLSVTRHEGKTRAVMKIQEGCDRYCAYCVIPYVRGPVRSMALADIREEAGRLARAGYKEIVLTGIHLASYGRETGETLQDAIRAVHDTEGILRVRLGSLEPLVVTDEFLREIVAFHKLCPQFHLSLQSGSGGVLRRMRRRYTPEAYLSAARKLQSAFPGCALTTDVLTGFPGETDAEAAETLRFVEEVGFARIHVFPYSRRKGTLADQMPLQVPEPIKKARTAELIALGNRLEADFVQKLVGQAVDVLFEEDMGGGIAEGYTGSFVRVRANASPGEVKSVHVDSADGTAAEGRVIEGGA